MQKLDTTQYELKENCHFVDAFHLESARANPSAKKIRDSQDNQGNSLQEIQHAHIMKKIKINPHKDQCFYLELNDIAAFIARFVVMGVPINKIGDIVSSEYLNLPAGINLENWVKDVVNILVTFDSIQVRTQNPNFQDPDQQQPPQQIGDPVEYKCNYKIDFKVNPIGLGIFKG